MNISINFGGAIVLLAVIFTIGDIIRHGIDKNNEIAKDK